jgi:hypothetical protein
MMADISIVDNPEERVKATFATLTGISSLLPQMRLYLSYRATGFSKRESCALAKVGESTIRRWAAGNPEFNQLENEQIGNLVEQFGHKYLELEFLRNYRLALRKDFDIFLKSVAMPDSLTSQENSYLLKARGHYTPEQLAIIRKMVEAGGLGELDFTQLVLQFSQQPQTVEARRIVISGKDGQAKGQQSNP